MSYRIENGRYCILLFLFGAETAELNGACGHFAFFCDQENLKSIVNAFLSRNMNSSRMAPAAGQK